ncbi:unnamed protein product [Aphanomyces euteiches]
MFSVVTSLSHNPPTMKKEVRLLGVEWFSLLGPTISTITFYEATTSTTDLHHATKAYLKDRLQAIVEANPWLGGRLTCGWLGSNLTLHFDPDAPSAIRVEEVELPELSSEINYDRLVSMCAPLEVQSGLSVLNTDLPLLRVHWITVSDTQGALFFSLSHGLGDGYTYYRLYGMLSAGKPVEALTFDRLGDYEARAEAAIKGGNDAMAMLKTPSFACNMVGNVLFGKTPVTVMQTFNASWIEQEKAKYKTMSSTGYVSTNDVITSWVFRTSQCKVGFMAINFRGRIQDVDNHLAGNYETTLGYQPEDYATPALIRESLAVNGLRRVRSGAFPWMFTGATTVVSTWVTLYEPANLAGWAMVEHVPIVGVKPPFTTGAIIFQRTATSIGIIYGSRAPVDLDKEETLVPL